MKTDFFQNLIELKAAGDFTIHIKQEEYGQLKVSVILVNEKVDDDAKNIIPAMNFQGTATELDEGFFEALQKPVEKASTLFTNMLDFEEALEKTQANAKMEREKSDVEKKAKDERKKKYDSVIKRVNDLEERKRFGEAIGAMPNCIDFPEQADEIKTRMDELRKKHGQLELL